MTPLTKKHKDSERSITPHGGASLLVDVLPLIRFMDQRSKKVMRLKSNLTNALGRIFIVTD